MILAYFIIGALLSCLRYVLARKGHLSEYLYVSYNYHDINFDRKIISSYSEKRYKNSNYFDGENTVWAYVQLGLLVIFWLPVYTWIGITNGLSHFIKDKKK